MQFSKISSSHGCESSPASAIPTQFMKTEKGEEENNRKEKCAGRRLENDDLPLTFCVRVQWRYLYMLSALRVTLARTIAE